MLVKVCWLMFVSCISLSVVRAQRVYAATGQASATLSIPLVGVVSEVQSPGNAYDTDHSNYATLVTNLGAVGLVDAWLNLQFGVTKPKSDSPVFVQVAVLGGGVVELLGATSLQPTFGGALVGSSYSGTTLLSLLGGAYSAGSVRTVALSAPGVTYDGVRLRITTTIGLGPSARYYDAFFIQPPAVSNTSVCTGQSIVLTVTNPQSGYTYAWFESQNGGTAVATTSGSFTTPVLTSAKSYYVEAREGSTSFPSARTKVDVGIYMKPVTPLVQLNH